MATPDRPSGKLKLYLMNKKGLSVLDALVGSFGRDLIDCVVTARDLGAVSDYNMEIRELCARNEIPCFDRKQDPGVVASVAFDIAVGWRWMLPSDATLIVFHDSLLPKYRGFAPLVSALLNREPHIGVTALFATDRFDQGDIIGQEVVPVHYPIALEAAIDLIAESYAALACRIAASAISGDPLPRTPQDHGAATYSPWRDEEDYRVDWALSAADIHQFVLAVGFPYPGASSVVNGARVRILEADVVEGFAMARPAPGKILFIEAGRPHVVTGAGLVRINRLVSNDTREDLLPWTSLRSRFT
jgi:methionyl-tRNA formyltransferase